MDAEQFDSVAKALGQSNSRRGVVRTLTGAAVGGLLVAVGVSEAGAKKQNKKKQDSGRHSVTAQGKAMQEWRRRCCGKRARNLPAPTSRPTRTTAFSAAVSAPAPPAVPASRPAVT